MQFSNGAHQTRINKLHASRAPSYKSCVTILPHSEHSDVRNAFVTRGPAVCTIPFRRRNVRRRRSVRCERAQSTDPSFSLALRRASSDSGTRARSLAAAERAQICASPLSPSAITPTLADSQDSRRERGASDGSWVTWPAMPPAARSTRHLEKCCTSHLPKRNEGSDSGSRVLHLPGIEHAHSLALRSLFPSFTTSQRDSSHFVLETFVIRSLSPSQQFELTDFPTLTNRCWTALERLK